MSSPTQGTLPSLPRTHGTTRPITRWGTSLLHRELKPVTSSQYNTPNLDTLIIDMFATMYAAQGAGLAANQIGVDLRVFVYDITDPKGVRSWGVFCNPVVEVLDSAGKHQEFQASSKSGMQDRTEGCLSYPGFSTSVSRPRSVIIRGSNQYGKPLEVKASDLLATILQHEVDHLNGVVYGDHVSKAVREKMDVKYRELEKEKAYTEDWPVSKTRHTWIQNLS